MGQVVALAALLSDARVWRGQPSPLPSGAQPTGLAALDAVLPSGGWPESALTELLLPADGVVLNDIDWADIELTKTSDGAYLFTNPQGTVSPRMWGLPIVNTPAMTAGDFLVGNFAMGATVYDRMGVEVLEPAAKR